MNPNYRFEIAEVSNITDPNNYTHGTSIASSSRASSQTAHVERHMKYSTIQEVKSSQTSSYSSSTSYSSSSSSSSFSSSSHSLSSGGKLMLQNASDPDRVQALQLARDKIFTSSNSGRDGQKTSRDEFDQEFEDPFSVRSPINDLLNRGRIFTKSDDFLFPSQLSSNRFK